MGLLPDYSRQALAYDSTRGASPSVLRALRNALAGAPGEQLVDIGGGTGNYAQALASEGWLALVVDRSPAMLERASAKGLQTLTADARHLPFDDHSFGAAMLVSMLHHVDPPAAGLAEARRILRPGGRMALMVFTREDIAGAWIFDYFPSSEPWMAATHPPRAELLAELPGARLIPFDYEDLEDGAMAALLGHPRLLLEARWREQTSYFERMARDHTEELGRGLERLAANLDAGRDPTQVGHATMISWAKPANPI